MKIPLKLSSLIKYYILIFSYIMLIYYSLHPLHPIGEWDDYSLPIASILNDHDFAISDSDIEFYKKLFPDWADHIDNRALSGYTTKDGTEEMTWYFPVYSIVCIPFTVMLHFLNLPTVYAFAYTNLTVLIISLCVVLKYLNTNDTTKAILIAALSINPISLYIPWASAEVLIYS
ncbi:MAG: hypothetical protein IJ736_03760, partial [Firmicutes bacterium]|nr:hypothetical protein [Bacillota bacterium]